MTTATIIDELPNLTRQDLQKLCKKAGIEANGTDEELVNELKEAVQSGKVGAESLAISDGEEAGDKETEAAEDDTQVNTVAATPKDVATPRDTATPDNEPATDPAPTPKDPEPQTPEVSKKIAAELEVRATALASDERKVAVQTFDSQHKTDDDNGPEPAETPSKNVFDEAHEKLFERDDSIAAHWSTKRTPHNKRVGEPIEQGSSKRSKVEPLFMTPVRATPKMRTVTGTMSDRATRVKPAVSAAAAGSKTVAVGRTTRASKSQLSSTTLFADAEKPVETVPKRVTRKAPLPKFKATKPAATPAKNGDKLTVEKVVEKALERKPVEAPATPKRKKVSERLKTPRKLVVVGERPVTRSMSPRKPDAKPAESTAAPKTPARKPPVPRRIATPKSKLPAARKAPAKPTTHALPDLTHVQSKVKAFINKPAENKQKTENKPKESKRAPKLTEKTGKDNVPHYMKSTRAAENRSRGTHAKPQPPVKGQAAAKERGTKARATPYTRPTRTRTAAAAAKTAEKKA
ncbi:hypothetical protein DL89DRAFT_269823 [Linderina pennispora]|uniref:SAP domain-containing protein n=1 Tax=Linderina pennispora TaxID=61395 RepID=A0A1Y1VZU1_9FUNG|nr:uncharacterized protein DL89DRAFT_269823 [Linderina pennispora]ORX66780.1 hypothetical protein DL89DRAFT_269823 [Linderina pennispora]